MMQRKPLKINDQDPTREEQPHSIHDVRRDHDEEGVLEPILSDEERAERAPDRGDGDGRDDGEKPGCRERFGGMVVLREHWD